MTIYSLDVLLSQLGTSLLFHVPPSNLLASSLCMFPGVVGLPRCLSGKESTCQCRSHKGCVFDPRVVKISWNRKQQPAPVFFPGKFHGQRSQVGSIRSQRIRNNWKHTHTDTHTQTHTHTHTHTHTSQCGCERVPVDRDLQKTDQGLEGKRETTNLSSTATCWESKRSFW